MAYERCCLKDRIKDVLNELGDPATSIVAAGRMTPSRFADRAAGIRSIYAHNLRSEHPRGGFRQGAREHRGGALGARDAAENPWPAGQSSYEAHASVTPARSASSLTHLSQSA
jgi:hypothetical protein